MTIPTVPNLPAGYIVQAADLTNVAYGCYFLMNKPFTRVHQVSGSGQTITTTATPITFDTVDFDSDGMHSAGTPAVLTIQTPGFYKVRYMVNESTGITLTATVLVTTGSNNPAGSGITSKCWGSYVYGANTNLSFGAAGVIPPYLYAADFIEVTSQTPTGTATTGVSDCGSFLSLELVSI